MRRIGKLTLAVAGLCALAPAALADIVSLPFDPPVGARWTVTEKRTRETTRESGTTKQVAETTASLKLVSKSDDALVFDWTVESVKADGVTLEAGNVDPSFLLGAPVRFHADIDGSPSAVENLEGIKTTIIASATQSAGPTHPGLAVLKQLIERTDPETLASILLPQLSTIGACQYLQVDSAKPTVQDGMSPGMGGGAPIKTHTVLTLEDRGAANRPARIMMKQSLDPESATASMTQVMKAAAARTGKPLQGELPTFSRDQTLTCLVDTKTGEAVSVTSDMLIQADGGRRSDVREIAIRRQK